MCVDPERVPNNCNNYNYYLVPDDDNKGICNDCYYGVRHKLAGQ